MCCEFALHPSLYVMFPEVHPNSALEYYRVFAAKSAAIHV